MSPLLAQGGRPNNHLQHTVFRERDRALVCDRRANFGPTARTGSGQRPGPTSRHSSVGLRSRDSRVPDSRGSTQRELEGIAFLQKAWESCTMQITANTSGMVAELAMAADKDARDHCVVAIKGTFDTTNGAN